MNTESRPGRTPELRRNRYFLGKFMTARDFARDQHYFLERHRRHNLHLHGWGIVDGLEVESVGETAAQFEFVIRPGFAIDAEGREIHVGEEIKLAVPRERLDGPGELRVCLGYVEDERERVPALDRSRGEGDGFEFNVVADSARVELTSGRDDEARIALATIQGSLVRTDCRCYSSAGNTTAIEKISWTHGGELDRAELERSGWRLEVGVGRALAPASDSDDRSTGIYLQTCAIEVETSDRRRVRIDREPERTHDRAIGLVIDPEALESAADDARSRWVYVTLRCDFILDAAGRPIDGHFLGGRLPTSGRGPGGGTFESWFRIVDKASEEAER